MKIKKLREIQIDFKQILLAVRISIDGYLCLNDLNAYIPEKRLDHWLLKSFIKEFKEEVDNEINYPVSGELTEGKRKSSIITKEGRGGGTYAHPYMAYEFAMWLSPAFKLAVIKTYDKTVNMVQNWNVKRLTAANNSKLLAEAIDNSGENEKMHGHAYSNNARMINKLVFENPVKGCRDDATEEQLEDISYLESRNGAFIEIGIDYAERKKMLSELYARHQEQGIKKIEVKSNKVA